ncbi:alpha/beta hydrolase [Magnetovibrio sp. PR-2]|uniref:alpha/beta fold hydrolase n=1 Tax=Magnetovibrio sp. PR-2 TaxID=3120356 RepID=UPI002FCE4D8E
MRYVYIHGWGFDARFWQPLMERVGAGECLDLGYRAAQTSDIPPLDESDVVISHSFGTQFMLHKMLQHKPAALIAINGFARFTKADDFPKGVHPKLLNRMIQGFGLKPNQVFADFMGQCGDVTPYEGSLNWDRLAEDLTAMMDWDERAGLKELNVPVLALAGDADQVVSAEMSQASFDGFDLRMKAGGDHILPLSATDWCAEHINGFVAGLSK